MIAEVLLSWDVTNPLILLGLSCAEDAYGPK